MKELAKKYNAKECEKKWQEYWQDNNIFKFNWNDVKDRNKIYAIDTPPPHISGQLHMGHIFGFAQMDIIARYQRMTGKNVFYPIGYDDNGLPSERYVEKKINKKSKSMERHEFVEICDKEIKDAELLIKNSLIKAGYSFDFDAEYRTISPMSRKISQMSFLDLYYKNYLYRKEEPVIWDVVDQTALAQTEAEDKEVESQMNYIVFSLKENTKIENGKLKIENYDNNNYQFSTINSQLQHDSVVIMTTRPELLPACVALFVHPDDAEKYKGKSAITPLSVEVPILFDESVEKDKGTGIMMCCTFGDSADVEKYKKYKLPLKMIINEKGCLYFDNVPEIADKYKNRLDGLFTTKAREEILNILTEEGKIAKAPEKITHNVKVGERSKSPLEIIVKKQWNIKVLDIKDELHKKASEIKWYPEWMEGRIHSWIDGLSWDWTISRQRFFGVPVPCWYSLRQGEEGKVLLPTKEQLPVDPTKDLPIGYTRDEVIGETDVFDTWMTSSVSPQLSAQGINENYIGNEERFKALSLPFDLRPQGHDIIRTWAFCTLVKSYYHQNIIPWKNIFVNGFCLASDGTKMSKSKGNGVDPMKTIDEFGTDAVRYWTANSQLGTDTNYSTDMIKIGQKLITKLYNSGKFVEMCLLSLQNDDRIKDKNILFETKNLYAKKVNINSNDEIQVFVDMHNDGQIMNFVGFPDCLNTNFEREKELILKTQNTLDERILCYDKTTSEIIGYCKIGVPDKDNKVRIDYKLKKEFWNRGFGYEIVSNLINYIFNTLKLDVIIQTDPNVLNIASIKICEKCGFKKTNIKETFKNTRGNLLQFEIMTLCKGDFKFDRNILVLHNQIENCLIDKFILSKLHTVIKNYENALNNYDYSKALETIENFFWDDFCDNYLEIAKIRCYGINAIKYQNIELTEQQKKEITNGQISAILTIKKVFEALLKLFAPYLPHITDELYSCLYENDFNATKSISSRGNWININDFKKDENIEKIGEIAKNILAEVRKYKSDKNISIKEIIDNINVYCDADLINVVEDLKNVCNVGNINFIKSNEFKIEF